MLLLVKVANPFSVALVTINQSSKNARTITNASSTKRIEQHAKHADSRNVSWSECPNLDPDMEEDPIGSKFIA